MRLEPAGTEEDVHSFAGEGLHTPAERDPVRERGIHEREQPDAALRMPPPRKSFVPRSGRLVIVSHS